MRAAVYDFAHVNDRYQHGFVPNLNNTSSRGLENLWPLSSLSDPGVGRGVFWFSQPASFELRGSVSCTSRNSSKRLPLYGVVV